MIQELPSTSASDRRRILIVDDVEDNRVLLERYLTRAGFATELCDSGLAALASVSSNPPDVVLLDWLMPGLSGLETLQAIREHHDQNDVPIIVCTATGEEIAIVNAIKAGANDYVTKPINVPILMARLKSQLLRKEAVEILRHEKLVLEATLVERTRALLDMKPA